MGVPTENKPVMSLSAYIKSMICMHEISDICYGYTLIIIVYIHVFLYKKCFPLSVKLSTGF